MTLNTRIRGAPPLAALPFEPFNMHQMYTGIEVPDPITFVVGGRWLNRPNLYPRQGTLLKIIFLRDDLFTEYDLEVIDQWETAYRTTGYSGMPSNIMWRIRWLKAQGYKWFREVLLVMGRRAGKGYVTALAMAYVLWNYMAKGDPQGFYGIDRDQRLAALVFAGKRDQAKATVFGGLNNVITGSNCLAGETEVITLDGVKQIRDLVNTEPRLMTNNGVWVNAPIRSFGTQALQRITLTRNGVKKEIYATAEHRWFVKHRNPKTKHFEGDPREKTTATLQPGTHLQTVLPRSIARRRGSAPSQFGVAHGFVFGDGTRQGTKGCRVSIIADHKDEALLPYFSLSPRTATGIGGLPSFFKDLPSIDESASYLYGWLAGYFAADGCVDEDGVCVLTSANKGNLEFARIVCHRLGIGTFGIRGQNRVGKSRDGVATPMYSMNLVHDDLDTPFFLIERHRDRFTGWQKRNTSLDRRHWKVVSVEETDRVEEVFCAVVPGTHAFALEDNILTGNCFLPFISMAQTERLSIYAPHDFVRMRKMAERGIRSERDMATFEILPKESTALAGRGPTSFAQCLDPSVLVLKSDLTWSPIGDLVAGDHVVGLDEYPPILNAQRKLRDAVVLKVWNTRKRALRLTFDDGSSVVCSPDHKWLVRALGRGGNSVWTEAGKLTVGRQVRHLVDPWEPDDSRDAGYLAGFFDGEGCIPEVRNGKRLSSDVLFSQNPGPTLDGVLERLRRLGYQPIPYGGKKMFDGRRCQQWSLRGTAECMKFLGQIRPERLYANQRRAWEGCSLRGGLSKTGRQIGVHHKTITAVEELPEQRLVDITTTTRTFIADGLISHNCFDEWAHIIGVGGTGGGNEVYQAAKPSLDQFGKDAFIVEPSSPWQMLGQFYENYEEGIRLDADGNPARPNILVLQLASWLIYEDWERAGFLPLFPEGFQGDLNEYAEFDRLSCYQPLRGAIQVFDDEMQREKAANPETFAVEREARWATALAAYLNEQKVMEIFEPWMERPAKYGPPEITPQTRAVLVRTYKGHADPSKINDKFGYALAHTEYDAEGRAHAVFDMLGHFDPADYPDHIIDYEEVDDWLWDNVISVFMPEEFTYDQYNSVASIQRLQKRIRKASLPKHIQVFEKTATRPYDWQVKENSKAAINLNLVHAPFNERAQLELRFLQLVNGRVDHPTSGPVQSKDIADCMCECIHVLIGEQTQNFLHSDLNSLRPGMNTMGEPFPGMTQGNESDREVLNALAGFTRTRGNMERSTSRNRRRYY